MLDQKAMQIARNRLSAEAPRRQHVFEAALQRIQSELAMKGLGRSGALIQAVADVCAKEIEDAGDRLWEIVRELLRETRGAVSDVAASNLHTQIDELWIPYCSAEPERQFEAICQRDGVGPGPLRNATHFADRSIGARLRIKSEADQFVRSVNNRASSDDNGHHNPNVFLSHAASDVGIALLLKAEIERRLPGVKVFCSSDPIDLPPGTRWSAEIQRALRESSLLMFIASERGLQRPWVWFECGTFWFSRKKIIPICLGAVRKATLRPPLWELQAVNGDEPADLKTALAAVAEATGAAISDSSLLEELSEKLKQLDRDADADSQISSGWLGAEWDGKFLAYDGPYHALTRIEDTPFETSMQEALKAAGYTVALYDENHFAAIGEEGRRFIHLTDRRSWRCFVVKGNARLVARLS
jgi:hypothetical protein